MRATRIRIVLAVLAAMAMLGAACGGDSGGDALAQVMDSGKLRVSTDPAYPPQSSYDDASGQWEGFDIDVATEIAKRMGVEVAWETPAWDLIIAGGWNDRWDASVGSMTITPERLDVLYFTQPYYYTPAAIAVHADNTTITGPADLTGASVGVCGGCTYDTYLQGTLELPDASGTSTAIPSEVQDPSIVTYDTDSTAIQDLALGDGTRLDAVISALPTLLAAIDAGTPIKIVGEPLYYEPLSVALDKEAAADQTSLLSKVDGIVEEMHSDGTLSELSQKWYGTDLTVAQAA
jgi:polar amino acid transport system substrate-binding protein